MTKIVSPAAPSIWRAPQKVYQKFPLSSKASHNAEKMCWKVLRKWTKKPINHLLTVWENLLKSTPNTVWRRKVNSSFRRFTRNKAVKISPEPRQKSFWHISKENTNNIRILSPKAWNGTGKKWLSWISRGKNSKSNSKNASQRLRSKLTFNHQFWSLQLTTKRYVFCLNHWQKSDRSNHCSCCSGVRGTGSKQQLFMRSVTEIFMAETFMTQLLLFGRRQTEKPTTPLRGTLTIGGIRPMVMWTMRERRPFCCSSIGGRNTFRKTRIISYSATMVMDQHLEVV